MNFKVNFSEQSEGFSTRFAEVQNVGTTDHDLLTNRCIPDQHCIGSITGLEDALAEKLPANSFVFGTTDGTVYEGSAGAKNAEDIAFVKQALIEAGTITKIEVEQAYTSRVTADGQTIVDGQKTPVTLIKGSTVRCENLVDIDAMVNSAFTKNGDVYTLTRNGSDRFSGKFTFSSPLPAGVYSYGFTLVKNTTIYTRWLQIAMDYEDGTATTTGMNSGETQRVLTATKPLKSITFYLEGGDRENDGAYISFKDFMLNEGSTLKPYQPYFTGLKHAKIDGVVSTGRNLFDKSKTKDGYEILSTTADKVNPEWFVTNLIPVLPNTKYVVSGKPTGTAVIYYDISQNPNGNLGGGADGVFTTLADVYFIKLNGLLTEKDTFQLEVGSTATEYTPFIQETYRLPETLELPEWDRFNPQTGEITRGTGRYVITGEENWYYSNQNTANEEGIYRYDVNIKATPIAGITGVANYDIVCTHFPTVKNTGGVGVWGVVGADLQLRIRDKYSSVEELKSWLKAQKDSGNPVIFEYEITSTVETLENTPKTYTAYNQGNETAVLENVEFGAIPTITNNYFKVVQK